jgi:phosphatidylglycerol---prolipoprotein diacylglyceryl transferase
VHPYLFHIGSWGQPTYGLLVALGMLSGLVVLFRLSRQQGLDPDKMWNIAFLAIFSGVVGAKLLMFLVDFGYYSKHPGEIFSLGTLQAGGVFSGGLVLAIAVCWWYMRKNNIPFLRAADCFAPGLALGHAFGRIGCFAAGCCYGHPTNAPWAVIFTNPASQVDVNLLGVPIHPTQLYEMIVEFANFALLYWLIKRKRFEGQIVGTYMFIYGIARFFLEFLRGDPGRGEVFGIITGTQLIAIGLVIAGGILWAVRVPLQEPAPIAAAPSAKAKQLVPSH